MPGPLCRNKYILAGQIKRCSYENGAESQYSPIADNRNEDKVSIFDPPDSIQVILNGDH